MDVRLDLFEALFVADTEVLLFVHDQQRQIAELDALAEKRVRADDNVDRALLDTLANIGKHLWPNQARRLRYPHRQTGKALAERFEMLARQQRRWNDHRN